MTYNKAMEESIFTKIIKGEIPCHKVYEDDKTLAFMDIHPIRSGHVLVISKKQVDHLWDLEDTDYQAVMATAKLVANRIREVLRPLRVGVHVEGLEVPHAHIHLFPFNTADEFWARPSTADPDHTALAAMAERLYFEDVQ